MEKSAVTTRRADELKPGDVIAAGFLPGSEPSDVLFTHTYVDPGGHSWVIVVHEYDDASADVQWFLAEKPIPVEPRPADPSGLDFSREAEVTEAGPVPAGVDGQPVGRAAQAEPLCHCHHDPEHGGHPAGSEGCWQS